jgi:hypothetical protein
MDKETLQIPLAVPTFPRSASLDKDAYLKNCYIDKSKTGKSFAVKRPGFLVGSEGVTTGLSRGIFYGPNGGLFYIDTNEQLQRIGFDPIGGLGNWSPLMQYNGGGGPVVNGPGKSYPINDGSGNPPPKGISPPIYPGSNSYWETFGPDSTVFSGRTLTAVSPYGGGFPDITIVGSLGSMLIGSETEVSPPHVNWSYWQHTVNLLVSWGGDSIGYDDFPSGYFVCMKVSSPYGIQYTLSLYPDYYTVSVPGPTTWHLDFFPLGTVNFVASSELGGRNSLYITSSIT